ncbi:MAG: hypothetical protein NTV74_04065 [Euryarchaeota archaeon]|nr:hypothetical protein [Euryarchaeota archaeon]
MTYNNQRKTAIIRSITKITMVATIADFVLILLDAHSLNNAICFSPKLQFQNNYCLINPQITSVNLQNKKTHDYFLFFQYLFPKIYATIVIIVNTINAKLIGVLIPVLKKNIFKISKQIHNVESTHTACPGVLTGGITDILLHPFYFAYPFENINIFGGFYTDFIRPISF